MGLLSNIFGSDTEGAGGLLSGIGNALSENSNLLLGYGAGGNEGLARGAQIDDQARERRRKLAEDAKLKATYMDWANKNGMDSSTAALFNSDPDLARQIIAKRMTPRDPSSDIQEYEYAKKGGYNGSFADWQTKKAGAASGGAYGLNPIWGQDADGNTVPMQLGKDGTMIATKMPDGVKVSTGVDKVDLGTKWGLIDKRTGSIVGYEPKDIAGAEQQKVIGAAQGTEIVGAPAALDTSNQTLKEIEALRTHAGRKIGTGTSSVLPSIAGSAKKDFDVAVSQLKGKTFLQAYQGLKGTGAISEMEGQKAEQAIARLDVAQSEPEFLRALQDLEDVIKIGQQRIKTRTRAQPTAPADAPTATPSGKTSGGIPWSVKR